MPGSLISCQCICTTTLCMHSIKAGVPQALRSNKRIDGLYLYVRTSAPSVLSARQKQRLKEADSTIQKRLSWAGAQVAKAQKPGLFDNIVENTQLDQVCMQHNERAIQHTVKLSGLLQHAAALTSSLLCAVVVRSATCQLCVVHGMRTSSLGYNFKHPEHLHISSRSAVVYLCFQSRYVTWLPALRCT